MKTLDFNSKGMANKSKRNHLELNRRANTSVHDNTPVQNNTSVLHATNTSVYNGASGHTRHICVLGQICAQRHAWAPCHRHSCRQWCILGTEAQLYTRAHLCIMARPVHHAPRHFCLQRCIWAQQHIRIPGGICVQWSVCDTVQEQTSADRIGRCGYAPLVICETVIGSGCHL